MLDFEQQARKKALEYYQLTAPEKSEEELAQQPGFADLVIYFSRLLLEPNLPPSGE